jgi:uncharacterized protein YbjQ (UPF0145 family)
MKTKDVAAAHGIDKDSFEDWLKEHREDDYSLGAFGGMSIDDEKVDSLILEFKKYEKVREKEEAAANEAADAKKAKAKEAAAAKQQALSSMLISSGFNFDGYTITKYSGYISGDGATAVDRDGLYTRESGWTGTKVTGVGAELLMSLAELRRNALFELKEAAYDLGCNAIIGVDFDYLTLDPVTINSQGQQIFQPYMFAVTANGNAVVIERK